MSVLRRVSCARSRNTTEAKNPRALSWVGLCAAVIALGATPARADHSLDHAAEHPVVEPAVVAPNLRLDVAYDYLHLGTTEATANGTTIRIPNFDGHAGSVDLIGTMPIWGPVGGRLLARFGYGHAQRDIAGLDRGNNEISRYGAGAEIFLRDPEIGEFSVGGGFDRLDGDNSVEADRWNGTARAALFMPNLGNGPLDWVVQFDFSHRDISGIGGPIDLDADTFTVTGFAGWYLTENIQFALGGRWDRAEEEFSSEDDREGFANVRWRVPGPISVELNFGGSIGTSEYKRSPLRNDNRLVYGATAGLVLRVGSGATLLDSIRRYD